MDERDSHLLRTKGLAFFGAIMAGQSHEVTNVLNIINELVGLQGDILLGAEQGRPVNTAKLKDVRERIQNQVKRGDTLIRCMNRFAHSVDCPVTVFDLKEDLEHIMYLAQRSANLRKTVLDREFPEESLPLETSPFGFKQAVFTCIEMALAASAEKRRVTVSYQVSDRGADITIKSADAILPGPAVTEKQAYLSLLLRELGGKCLALPAAGDFLRFVLFFPRPATETRAGTTEAQSRPSREDSHAG